jgi:hypothetical protein
MLPDSTGHIKPVGSVRGSWQGGGSQYRNIPRSPTRRLVPDLADYKDEYDYDCETGKPEESMVNIEFIAWRISLGVRSL